MPADEAIVITSTSRWATWDSSWASTPSSSSAVELAEDAGGHADHRAVRRAAGRERVGHVDVGDADPGLRHVGERAEPVDHAVQLGRLLGVTSRARMARIATLSENHHW